MKKRLCHDVPCEVAEFAGLTEREMQRIILGYLMTRPEGAGEDEIREAIEWVGETLVMGAVAKLVAQGELLLGRADGDWTFRKPTPQEKERLLELDDEK